ncbi:MAG: DUF3426 domain-containing protein [Burkholderiaceae bacterium]|nr:MAG: DUF3426 domain-containing protein [Burkholderiaceae bacterium]
MLVTQCPECQTRFRVASEQLKLRHGMVRCGVCSHVFNGVSHMSYLAESEQVLAPTAATTTVKPAALKKVAELIESTLREDREPDDPITLMDLSDAEETVFAETVPEEAEAEDTAGTEAPVDPLDAIESGLEDPRTSEEIPIEESTLPSLELAQAGFLREARRARWVSAVYLALFMLGLVLLLGQGAYVFRNTLAAHWPASKPWLQTFCSQLHCEITPLQQPEVISIEASDLQAAHQQKDVYTLNVTLRNNSRFAQRFPALEVWLTNTQNRTVARKVFQATDYLADKPESLNEGLLARNEYTLKLHWRATDVEASGYHVYLFYP